MSFGIAAAGECSASCAEACCEDTEIVVYGSARHRLEIDGTSFIADANMDWTQYMRSRLGVKASRGNSGMVFEVQDSRVLGDSPGTLSMTNGGHDITIPDDEYGDISISRNDFGVRQAYLWHKPCDKSSVKVGRFGVNMHNQRLIGQVGWHNVGRTTEGLLFKRAMNDNITLIGAALQVAEQNFDDNDGKNVTDPMFYALDLNFAEQGFDVFLYMLTGGIDLLSDSDYSAIRGEDVKLMTYGAYSKREFGSNMWYDAMFAMQSGSVEEWDPASKGDKFDVSGMLINAEIGMKLDGGTKVSALVDYTTGDDPETATEGEAFNNLLYTGHKWNGYMDYFLGGVDTGLTDIALRVAHPINDTMWLKADAHMFKSTEEYADGKSSLGNELDITLVKKAGDMKIQGGLSIFMPNEDRYGTDAEMAKWAYLQSSFGF